MPKQPGGFSKFERIEALREVLKRWGKLKKTEIDERVAAKLGCEAEAISRALYRDLEVLENMREITTTHFTRDGLKIDHFNPEQHKNTVCEYAVPESESQIRGSKRLAGCGIGLAASTRLIQEITVSDGSKPTSPNPCIGFYFHAGGQPHSIFFGTASLPFQVCVGRSVNEKERSKLLADAESVIGKRTVYLSVPNPAISSYRGPEKIGHLILSFEKPSTVNLRDLGSKNGTSYQELSVDQAERLIKKNSSAGKSTSTYLITPKAALAEKKTLPPHETQAVALPNEILVSLEFSIIIK
jgi:hypothetical protein